MESGATETAIVQFNPELASCGLARHFVEDRVHAWHRDDLRDTAALCATELASNAVLHSRQPFVLTVRTAGEGLRIDVLDRCPDQFPVMTPASGSAIDLTLLGTAGRGMQIVASLAARWGFFATAEAKTVWVEVRAEPVTQPSPPLVSPRPVPVPSGTSIDLLFVGMPVRAAVASGIQTEEVIREIQLDQGMDQAAAGPPSGSVQSLVEIARFFSLLDRSAPVRLAGRHAALLAAAEGRERFDLPLSCTLDALRSLPELSRVLADFDRRTDLPQPRLSDEVVAFREWLNEETARQVDGAPPSRYPR